MLLEWCAAVGRTRVCTHVAAAPRGAVTHRREPSGGLSRGFGTLAALVLASQLLASAAKAGCSPDGATVNCTGTGGCAGTKTCNYPNWSACVCNGFTFAGTLTNNAGSAFTSPGAGVSVLDSSGGSMAGPSTAGASSYSFTGVNGGSGVYTLQSDIVANYSVRTQVGTAAFVVGNSAGGFTTGKTVNFKYDPVTQLAANASQSYATVGVPFTVTVGAKDAFGNLAWGYHDNVSFSIPVRYGSNATSTSQSFSTGDQGQKAFTATLSTTGAQSITVTDSTLSLTGTTSVTAVAAPNASITSPSYATVSSSFSALVPTQSGSTYAWSLSGAGSISGSTTAASVTVNVGASTGTVTLYCTVTNQAGTAASGSASVSVVSAPSTPAITRPTYVTVNTSASATIAAQSGMTYSWTITGGSGAAVLSGGTTTAATFGAGTATGAKTLSCAVTNAAGTTATSSVTVTVVALPAVPVVAAPAYATQGATGLVGSTGAQSGVTYSWSISGGTGAAVQGSTTSTSVGFSAGSVVGGLTLSCAVSNLAGTAVTGQATVNVVAPPNASITVGWTSGSPTAGTSNNSASVPAQGGTFVWSLPQVPASSSPASITSGGSTRSIGFNAGNAGGSSAQLTIQCIVTNQAGQSVTGSFTATVLPDATTTTPVISGIPSPVNPYAAQAFTVGLKDAYGNPITSVGAAITIQFSTLNASDQVPQPLLVPAGAFTPIQDSGLAFHVPGAGQSLTATTSSPSLLAGRAGSQTGITVNNDTTPPTVTLIANPPGGAWPGSPNYSTVSTVSIAGAYADTGSGINVATITLTSNTTPVAGLTITSSSISGNVTLSGSGTRLNALALTVRDNLGNQTIQPLNLYYDLVAPSATITSPADGAVTTSTSVSVTGTASDDTGVASVVVNGVTATLSPGAGSTQVSFTAQVPVAADSTTAITATVTDMVNRSATASVSNLAGRTAARLTHITADSSLGTVPSVCNP